MSIKAQMSTILNGKWELGEGGITNKASIKYVQFYFKTDEVNMAKYYHFKIWMVGVIL